MGVRFTRVLLLLVVGSALTSGCRRGVDDAVPLATPTVTLDRAEVAIGSPVEMTYRFVVAPDAAFTRDYLVFVHFLDTDREILWTDDHPPEVPTSQWKPGSTIEYTRTTFIPKFPYTGETRVEVGLFAQGNDGDRVPMSGNNQGQRSYQVATFNLRPQSDTLFVVFKDGWQDTEVSSDGPGVEWQWSKKEGVLAFRNPMRDATFYLLADQPLAAAGTQQVDVRLGGESIDRFALPAGGRELRKIDIPASRFGAADSTEITVAVEKTFIPAAIPELNSRDARELGVRVFRAYLQTK